MSTRSQIGFYEKTPTNVVKEKPNVLLYKHSDGYPSGNLPIILKFILRFFKDSKFDKDHNPFKFSDTEYPSAWFMYWMISGHVKWGIDYLKKTKSKPNSWNPADGMSFSGFGICEDYHSDIEWYYAITPDEVIVYRWNGWGKVTKAHEEMRVNISDFIKASRKKSKKTYKVEEILPYLPFQDDEDRNSFRKFMEEKDMCEVLQYCDDKDDRYNLLRYHLNAAFETPYNDLPTMINAVDPIIKGIVKYRLDKKI